MVVDALPAASSRLTTPDPTYQAGSGVVQPPQLDGGLIALGVRGSR